jgi:hypothetical protein
MIEFLAIIFVLFAIGLLSRQHEKTIWNKGISRASGLSWRYFDTDSSNSRGYTDGVGNTCWIYWDIEAAHSIKETT